MTKSDRKTLFACAKEFEMDAIYALSKSRSEKYREYARAIRRVLKGKKK